MQKKLAPAPIPEITERWALFIDIDGTLVDFAARPEMVKIDAHTRSLLGRLQPLLGGALAILSGRSLSDVDQLLSPLVLPAGALHGLEIRDYAGMQELAAPPTEVSEKVRRACADGVSDLDGVWVEEKSGIGFALHYRAAPLHGPSVQQLAQSIAKTTSGAYTIQLGDCVAELRPAGHDKGTALRALLKKPPFEGRRPIMLGDDLTDESAFEVANEMGGHSIIVNEHRPTKASYALASPENVLGWIEALINRLDRDGAER